MLGHLVYNRGADAEFSSARSEAGWMRRLIRALFGRKR